MSVTVERAIPFAEKEGFRFLEVDVYRPADQQGACNEIVRLAERVATEAALSHIGHRIGVVKLRRGSVVRAGAAAIVDHGHRTAVQDLAFHLS